MRARLLLAGLFIATAASTLGLPTADAQERVVDKPTPAPAEQRIQLATERVETTPEMWFYQQEQARYDNPQLAVRRRAELAGAQRQARLARMKALGLSKMRPTVSPTPMFGNWFDTPVIYYWGIGYRTVEVVPPMAAYR